MAHNLLNQMHVSQFKDNDIADIPRTGDIIGPDNDRLAISCIPSASSKGKYYRLMTRIQNKKAATGIITSNTSGFICLLSRVPQLGEVIFIENVYMGTAFGKLIRL